MNADCDARKIDPFMGLKVAGITGKMNTVLHVSSKGKWTSMDSNHSSWRPIWILSLMLGLLPLVWVTITEGQTTSITSSGLGTTISPPSIDPAGRPNYIITGGTRPGDGPNLFHSFGDFSVGTNNVARFFNESGRATTNILSRVTGGQTSNIYGTIQTAGFGTAALWLINPAGIVFGLTASLNVGGSAHFSTADYLRMSDGAQFFASLTKQSTLSSAPVTAFGFLGKLSDDKLVYEINNITVEGGPTDLSVAKGQSLSLVGGTLSITGRTVSAPEGQINLASVQFYLPPASFTEIPVADRSQGGTILIRKGQFVGADTGAVILGENAVIRTDATPGGKAGSIDIEAKTLNLSPGSLISAATAEVAKDGNSSTITASELIRISGATIVSDPLASGNQANVTITSPGLVVLTDASIKTDVTALGEQAGNISIQSDQLAMDNARLEAVVSRASGGQSGDVTSGGDIALTATSMNLSNTTLINSTIGNTKAGSMTLRGQDIVLQNNTNLRGLSTLSLGGPGNVGPTGGRAGTVTIEGINGPAQNVTISNSAINTSIATAGSPFSLPADIRITSQGVTLTDHAQINASSSGEASSGNIGIHTNKLTMINGAMISSNSTRTDGAAGGAGAILIGGVNGPATNISLDNSSISTTISGGNELLISSGNIHLTAQAIRLANGARITADTNGDTSAGSIILNVSNLATSGGAMVSSRSTSTGASAGSAGELVIQGAQGERSFAESITLDDSILSITSKGGDPGHISILGRSISLENGTHIEADTSGGGSGGNILFQGSGAGIGSIATTNFAASNGVRISTNSTGTADAGNVSVVSGNIFIRDSTVSTSATQTSGGDIMLTAPNIVRLVGANLTSSVNGPANSNGGNITIDTAHPQFVIMQGNSQILARANAGQGGAITIIGGVVLQEPGSVLDATAGPAGISGSINIQAPFQQLSGAIAPLPQAFAIATNLYGQRCAAEKGGQFSSFVQGVRDGVPPQPGDLIPSPFLLELDEAPLSAGSQSIPSLAAIRLGLPAFEQTSRSSLTVFAGCRS